MKWINENKVKGEESDQDFQKFVENETKTRDQKRYGRDGNHEIYSERFAYKGVPYLIKIIRYYQIGVPINSIKSINDLGKHAVLEYPDELKPLANFLCRSGIEQITELYEFLYADTLHSGQEHWTLKQMVDHLHKTAKQDIDALPKLKRKVKAKFHEIDQELLKLSKFWNGETK